MANFQEFLPTLLRFEGGYVDDPADPGGATNKGITFGTFRQYASNLLQVRPTLEALRDLTDEQAGRIYKVEYWDRIYGDDFSFQPLANIVFDFNVNAGWHAITTLIQVLNRVGANHAPNSTLTPQLVDSLQYHDPINIYTQYKEARRAYYINLANENPSLRRFLQGWLNRVDAFPSFHQNPPVPSTPMSVLPPLRGLEGAVLLSHQEAATTTTEQPEATAIPSRTPKANFQEFLPTLLRFEGGYVDDPADPGGATNKGITFGTFRQYASNLLQVRPTLEALRNLTDEQAGRIYKVEYWDRIYGDDFSFQPLANIVFDFNVNAGWHAITTLIQVLNRVGANHAPNSTLTPQLVDSLQYHDPINIYTQYKEARRAYYINLANENPSLRRFLQGWLNRVDAFPSFHSLASPA
ncbi:hypothetical protein KIK84_04785 [Curvibacter sp. CHRR-16]|uniref:glycoside hydrolase family 108 protein n=1 Tax=Curvibacter sp. CHRR-16 TaxID=2835872 RepID=UPI001BDA2E19|nr:glycosyl hydrolase 108 family protein [Curvibacter sp. CHRR-16]MBT0569629.1 hypothetical protein [Curvibacter sp. CHRR-16]